MSNLFHPHHPTRTDRSAGQVVEMPGTAPGRREIARITIMPPMCPLVGRGSSARFMPALAATPAIYDTVYPEEAGAESRPKNTRISGRIGVGVGIGAGKQDGSDHNGADSIDVEANSIDVIVDAFREKFGERAADVAARQIERAGPDTVGVWLEIASRLSIR